jgi:hypothetical protein
LSAAGAPVNRLHAGASALFAEAPLRPLGSRRLGWPAAAMGALAVLVGAAVSLLRQPGAGALDTVWAEDGGIFLTDAVGSGPSALTKSYAGYYHLVPRLLASLATLAPPGAVSAVLAVQAALGTALVAVLVYVASGAHLTSQPARVAASAIVVVAPLAQDDALNSIANLHWYGLYAMFWMLLWSPRGRAGRVVSAVAVALVAASDILVLAFVPLALVRAVRRRPDGQRDRHGLVLAVLLGIGLALQFAGLLFGSSSRNLSPNPVKPLIGYLIRVAPSPIIGQRWLGTGEVHTRWLVLAGVAWLVLAAVAVVAWLRPAWSGPVRPGWALAITALLHSVALYILPVLLSGVATTRYALAPAMLLVTALVALLQPEPGRRPVALYALLTLLAVICAVNLRLDNTRADGPRWGVELDRARASCATPVPPGPSVPAVDVPIPPVNEQHWRARLSCRYVRG